MAVNCTRRSQEYYTIHDAVSPKWLTCIMMSRTRAGVKIRRHAIYVQRPAKAMADQEDHITEDETLPHHGEHSDLELHAVAVTVAKAVASSMQEALQPLLWLIPSALATPPPTAITGDKSKKAPSPDDTPGTSGKCLLSRRRSALAQYLSGREFTGSDTQPSSRQNLTMAVTYQNRACGSQSLSQAVAVSHQRQAATISHWSQAATISHRSQAATVSHRSQAVTVSHRSQAATVSHRSQPVTVSHQRQAATVSHQSLAAAVSHQSQVATVRH